METPESKFTVAVLGLPVKEEGDTKKYLLSRRHAPEKPGIHDKWQLVGGGMEFGEAPEQTLTREFQEELQVAVELLFPHPIATTKIWLPEEGAYEEPRHLVLLCYVITIHDQTPNTDADEETSEWGWFDLDEIDQLECLPNTQQIIYSAVELLRQVGK